MGLNTSTNNRLPLFYVYEPVRGKSEVLHNPSLLDCADYVSTEYDLLDIKADSEASNIWAPRSRQQK